LLFNPPLVLLSVIWTGERGLWLGLAVAVVDSFTVGVLLKRQWTPPERGWMAAVLRVFGVRSG
jgi:hypothetical protein